MLASINFIVTDQKVKLRRLGMEEQLATQMFDEVRAKKRKYFDKYHAEILRILSARGLLNKRIPSEIRRLQQTLREETDRGCVLAGVAFLDDAMADLLRAHMVPDEKCFKDLLRPSGPLGSLSVRVDFCYLLGIIGADTRTELNRLRKIRNAFAHDSLPVSFKDQAVVSQCRELTFGLWLYDEQSPRRRFIRALLTLLGLIHGTQQCAKRPVRWKTTFTPKELRELRRRFRDVEKVLHDD